MDVDTARDFRKAGLALAHDRSLRCAIVYGAGGVSCSGADMKYIRALGGKTDFEYLKPNGAGTPATYGEGFKEILEYLHSTISKIKRAAKPFIAAVDGIVAAGGFGIAMACDLALASERASFEWAYHKPTQAFAVAKSLLHQAAGADQLDYHPDQQLQHLARIADGEDYAEGMAAFVERRAAKISGRG
jgi:enoyl-CoA hydratase/carnithine racemase